MRSGLLRSTFIAATLVMAAASTQAADMVAPVYKAPVGYDWTGFYVGGHGGWAQANFDFYTAVSGTPSQQSKGGFGGLQAGYNVQHRNIVLGIEADASFGHLSDLVPDGNFITETTDIKAFGSARARLGYAFGRILPYVTGGLGWATDTAGENCPAGAQFAHCKATGPYNVESTETHFGWTAGGGIEMALDRGWSVKAEYLHADLGAKFYPFQVPISSPRLPSLTMDIVKAGVNWRLPY